MIIKYLRLPRLQNLTPANQTLLTGTRSYSSPQHSLTLQAIGCMQIPKVIQIFRRNQSASDVCWLIKTPSPRCRGATATLQWPSSIDHRCKVRAIKGVPTLAFVTGNGAKKTRKQRFEI